MKIVIGIIIGAALAFAIPYILGAVIVGEVGYMCMTRGGC